MANLKTKNVFIDTEVFEAHNFVFSSKTFVELVRLAKANVINILVTSITIGEINSHIVARINDAFAKLKKFRNEEGRILQNVQGYEIISTKADKQKSADEIKNNFKQFLTDVGGTVIDTASVNPENVFSDYFALKPPFGEGRKKEEFPDAFAQHALVDWCKKNRSTTYVVSANKDWHISNSYFFPLEKIDEFIDAAVKDEAGEAMTLRFLNIYKKHTDIVKKAVIDSFKDSDFYISDVDGDVDGIKVEVIKLDEPFVLEIDESTATASVDVEIQYIANVSYLNDDEGIWDGEDHVWSYRPTVYGEAAEEDRFEAELEIHYDLETDELLDVICTISKTFAVTVEPTDYELK